MRCRDGHDRARHQRCGRGVAMQHFRVPKRRSRWTAALAQHRQRHTAPGSIAVVMSFACFVDEEFAANPLSDSVALHFGKSASKHDTQVVVDVLVRGQLFERPVKSKAERLSAALVIGDHSERRAKIQGTWFMRHRGNTIRASEQLQAGSKKGPPQRDGPSLFLNRKSAGLSPTSPVPASSPSLRCSPAAIRGCPCRGEGPCWRALACSG